MEDLKEQIISYLYSQEVKDTYGRFVETNASEGTITVTKNKQLTTEQEMVEYLRELVNSEMFMNENKRNMALMLNNLRSTNAIQEKESVSIPTFEELTLSDKLIIVMGSVYNILVDYINEIKSLNNGSIPFAMYYVQAFLNEFKSHIMTIDFSENQVVKHLLNFHTIDFYKDGNKIDIEKFYFNNPTNTKVLGTILNITMVATSEIPKESIVELTNFYKGVN